MAKFRRGHYCRYKIWESLGRQKDEMSGGNVEEVLIYVFLGRVAPNKEIP